MSDYQSIHSGSTIDSRVTLAQANYQEIQALKARMNDAESDLEAKADATSVTAVSSRVGGVEAKMSSAASTSNKLIDKAYVDNALSGKVDKSGGKGLSTNDFTNDYKTKLDGLPTGLAISNALDTKASASSVTTIESKIPSAASSSNQLADKAFVNSALANKVDKVTGKGLSTNDYTNEEKSKVASIGDLDELETEDKTSIVAAINEAATTGSGGGASLEGYVVVDSIGELPSVGQPNLGYLVGTHLYLYVGTGGDTLDGKYKDAGEFRGPEGVGFQSIASQQDGTVVITLTNGDTITIDLNHNHPQYPKYVYCSSQSAYDAIVTKESDTLYLILETS